MNDLNFFSIYQVSNREQKDEKIYFYVATGILLGIIILTFTLNIVEILKLDKNIKTYTEQLEVSEMQSQLREATEVNTKIDILSKYETSLFQVANSIEKINVVSDELLNDICDSIPKEISFKDLNIEGYDVKISGTTHTRAAVGEFKHNLGKLSKIKTVHVNTIAKSNAVGEDYTFEIICVLKEIE